MIAGVMGSSLSTCLREHVDNVSMRMTQKLLLKCHSCSFVRLAGSYMEGQNAALRPASAYHLHAIQMVPPAPGYQDRENKQVYRQREMIEVHGGSVQPFLGYCKKHEVRRGHACRSRFFCKCM